MQKFGVMNVFAQKGSGDHVDVTNGGGKIATVTGTDVIRIIRAADSFVKFSNDAATTVATDGTQGMLLKANTEYFLLTNKAKFLVSSTAYNIANDNIVAVDLDPKN